jgi:hypothetical protein
MLPEPANVIGVEERRLEVRDIGRNDRLLRERLEAHRGRSSALVEETLRTHLG